MRRATGGLALALALVLVGGTLLAACSDDEGSEAFCARLAETPALDEVLAELDSSDPGGSRRRLEEGVRQFQSLLADAPGKIRADLARIVRGVELVLQAVEDNPDDLPGARADITGQVDELAGLAQAGERVVDYARTECGVDLVPAEGPNGTSATDPAPEGTDPDGTTGTGPEADGGG